MKIYLRLCFQTLLLFVLCLAVFSCNKPPEQKTEFQFFENEFSIRQTEDHSFVIDAKGKVKNASNFDLKNVVVTAYCRSCTEALVSEAWFVSDVEKMPNQVHKINYLASGATENFEFQEVAFCVSREKPDSLPDQIEVVVESYEVIKD